jgi:DnaK suppressor protein
MRAPVTHRAQPPSRRQYTALQNLREAGVRELRDSLRTLRDSVADLLEVKDAEERGLRETEQGLDLAVLQMKADTCRDIEGALKSIRAGTFGRCEKCGNVIPPARLQAVPFAVRCRDCQAKAEESGSGMKPAA